MPHRTLERQYQLQAQKRNEEALRIDYYRQTARYFEREAAAAKQFASWAIRGPETYTNRLEKLHKAAELHLRREKLKKLLQEENEQYQQELKEQKQKKSRTNEKLSLEDLQYKLLEKKAEQSLYYPNSCHRFRSYAVSPTDSTKKIESHNSTDDEHVVPHCSRSPNPNSQKHLRFSTSPSIERVLYNSGENGTEQGRRLDSESLILSKAPSEYSFQRNTRYTARNARCLQTLQGTNLCSNDWSTDQYESSIQSLRLSSPTNSTNEQQTNATHIFHASDRYSNIHMNNDQNKNVKNDEVDVRKSLNNISLVESYKSTNLTASEEVSDRSQESLSIDCNENIDQIEGNDTKNKRGLLRQEGSFKRSSDRIENFDKSVQMYRYLIHNDLKYKIFDLCKREHFFVVKQYWDEALRLREMRNKLISLKNKNLFENHDLKMNEETRCSGLRVIQARERLDNRRAKLCNGLLYSDEAKDLWKQWVREDDEIMKLEASAVRDVFLKKLEDEWKSLTLSDKKRIAQLYDKVTNKSCLQDEHKLAELIKVTNKQLRS